MLPYLPAVEQDEGVCSTVVHTGQGLGELEFADLGNVIWRPSDLALEEMHKATARHDVVCYFLEPANLTTGVLHNVFAH